MYNFSKKNAIDAFNNKKHPGTLVDESQFSFSYSNTDNNFILVVCRHTPTGSVWTEKGLLENYDNIKQILLNKAFNELVPIPESEVNKRFEYVIRNLKDL